MDKALTDFGKDTPPAGLARPLAALWWLKKGGLIMGPHWEKAHELCQMQEGDRAHDSVHALVHWIEGDESNAGYWYRRCGRRKAANIAAEWQALAEDLSG